MVKSLIVELNQLLVELWVVLLDLLLILRVNFFELPREV